MGRRPGATRGRGRSSDSATCLRDRSPSSLDDHLGSNPQMASPSATPSAPQHIHITPSVSPGDVISGTDQGSTSAPTGLPQLFLDHGDMYMSDDLSVSHRISDMIKTMFDGPYRNWSHTPHGVRNLWFQEFRKLCWWDPAIDAAVRAGFEKVASKCLKDASYRARKCLKLQSAVDRANRASDVGGLGPSVHYGGSSSFLHTKRKMEKKLNKVGFAEVYLKTHKKDDHFSCQRAQKTYETFEELQGQAKDSEADNGDIGNTDSSSSQREGELWYKATGGPSHGRVFGLGSQQQAAAFGVIGFQSSVRSPSPSQQLALTQETVNEMMRTTMQSYHAAFSSWSLQQFGVAPPAFLDPSQPSTSQHNRSPENPGDINDDDDNDNKKSFCFYLFDNI